MEATPLLTLPFLLRDQFAIFCIWGFVLENLPVSLAAQESLGMGSPCTRPRPASLILSALCSCLLGPWELVPQRTVQARVKGYPELDSDCSPGSETVLCQHCTDATPFQGFYVPTGPPPTATSSTTAAHDQPTRRLTTCPSAQRERRDIRPDRAPPGSDVGVSTCKMAAHHRQNTAGRRKVQVREPGSSTSRTWCAAPGSPPASRCLGPRPAGVAAWGAWDEARLAARGGAAALTARGRGRGRPAGPAAARNQNSRALGAEPGGAARPLRRGLGLAESGWACSPPTCLPLPLPCSCAPRRRRVGAEASGRFPGSPPAEETVDLGGGVAGGRRARRAAGFLRRTAHVGAPCPLVCGSLPRLGRRRCKRVPALVGKMSFGLWKLISFSPFLRLKCVSLILLSYFYNLLPKGKVLSNPSVCALCLRESAFVLGTFRVPITFSDARSRRPIQVFPAGIWPAVVMVWCTYPLNITEHLVRAPKYAKNQESIEISNTQAFLIKQHYMYGATG